MASRIYALLVGVNDYAPQVGKLHGCLNDVDHYHEFLTSQFDADVLDAVILKDAEATRENIIRHFRQHLCQATAADVAVFQYAGHGARWKSAEPFAEFFPDGMDEGLICYDSRRTPEHYDLADKELAVLLHEVAANQPHLAVILDCCHSGSGTRSAAGLRPRFSHTMPNPRPLDSYIDGYYSRKLESGQPLTPPVSRHVLLAGCDRTSVSFEGYDRRGIFSTALLNALQQSAGVTNYAELFLRVRGLVRGNPLTNGQTPQFEVYGGFDAYSGFLGQSVDAKRRPVVVSFENGWKAMCGALNGLPTEPEKTVEFSIYERGADPSQPLGTAAATSIGLSKTELNVSGLEIEPEKQYQAVITHMPVPAFPVWITGDADGLSVLRQFQDANENHGDISLQTDLDETMDYGLSAEQGVYHITNRRTELLIQGVKSYAPSAAEHVFRVLRAIANWHRGLKLQNHASHADTDTVPFQFFQLDEDDTPQPLSSDDLEFTVDADSNQVRGQFKAQNLSKQPLFMSLVYFNDQFGVQSMYNDRIEPTDENFTITLDGHADFTLSLDENEGNEAHHSFLLIVSAENIDDFMMTQPPLTIGEIVDPAAVSAHRGLQLRNKVPEITWFTKLTTIKLVRQSAQVSDRDVTLAGGQLKIKAHSAVTAAAGLTAASQASRGASDENNFCSELGEYGFELLPLATERGQSVNVLELNQIANADRLAEEPLHIELTTELEDDQYVLPLSFDGDHLCLAGDAFQDDAGVTQISIDQVPDTNGRQRGIGKSLKLYLFKVIFRREHVNQLVRFQFDDDQPPRQIASGVTEAASSANHILILLPGLMGDSAHMARGIDLIENDSGQKISDQFDLVLGYDYECFNTPLDKTAETLKNQLKQIGIEPSGGQQITVLAHGMGGLVARWLIEQGGGEPLIGHLVMCGTPNEGTPLGNVGLARNVAMALVTASLKFMPALAPMGAALLAGLLKSKMLTPTLEQMSPNSDFMHRLNASDDPKVPYTILAGDVSDYEESADGRFQKLLMKIGTSGWWNKLFGDQPNDMMASVGSIRGIASQRVPPPGRETVSCHHLNYFFAEQSMRGLAQIDWSRPVTVGGSANP